MLYQVNFNDTEMGIGTSSRLVEGPEVPNWGVFCNSLLDYAVDEVMEEAAEDGEHGPLHTYIGWPEGLEALMRILHDHGYSSLEPVATASYGGACIIRPDDHGVLSTESAERIGQYNAQIDQEELQGRAAERKGRLDPDIADATGWKMEPTPYLGTNKEAPQADEPQVEPTDGEEKVKRSLTEYMIRDMAFPGIVGHSADKMAPRKSAEIEIVADDPFVTTKADAPKKAAKKIRKKRAPEWGDKIEDPELRDLLFGG